MAEEERGSVAKAVTLLLDLFVTPLIIVLLWNWQFGSLRNFTYREMFCIVLMIKIATAG